MKDLIAKLHSSAADQILATFSTLEMQIQGFAKSSYEKDLRIAELEAQIAGESGQKPEHVAYAENGVLHWMTGRKFQNCELYTAPQAADTNKLREAILRADVTEPYGFSSSETLAFDRGVELALSAAADVAASTALQAPVREVPEGWQLVPIVSTSKMDRAGEDAYESRGYCDCGNAHGVSMEMVYDAMLAAAPLPAAPVQEPKQ